MIVYAYALGWYVACISGNIIIYDSDYGVFYNKGPGNIYDFGDGTVILSDFENKYDILETCKKGY